MLLSHVQAEDLPWRAWVADLGLVPLCLTVLAALGLHAVVFRILAVLARRTRWKLDELLVKRVQRPARVGLVLLGLQLLATSGRVTWMQPALSQSLAIAIITTLTWLSVVVLRAIEDHVKHRYDIQVADNLEARRVHTQIGVLTRTLSVFVIVIGVAVALMTFPRVRELGASLLASAGIAGLAIGLAARPVLENLIAGLQIALTQPIRIDDVVIIDGEWGRIEEITATYVVLRIWDERRLIVPFSRVIQEPFQNWTRKSARILGTVFLHTDYTVPVAAVRAELERIVRDTDLWDERVCVLQVTDAKPATLELRALVSASDSGRAWDLRVLVRERLIEFLRREYPEALPRTRVELPSGTQVAEPVA